MRVFTEVEVDGTRSNEMRKTQTWVRRFVCVVKPRQLVKDNRTDHVSNAPVTQEQVDAGDRAAHVCPFVLTSIERNEFWIEESDLTNNDQAKIEALLRQRMQDFMNLAPPHDPMGTGVPVPAPDTHIYRTFMMVFPKVIHARGKFPLWDDIHANLKPDFVNRGLMLGQFYHGCPFEEGAIYAPEYKSIILSSPVPAFAIRYMVVQDHIFNLHPKAAPWVSAAHHKFFP